MNKTDACTTCLNKRVATINGTPVELCALGQTFQQGDDPNAVTVTVPLCENFVDCGKCREARGLIDVSEDYRVNRRKVIEDTLREILVPNSITPSIQTFSKMIEDGENLLHSANILSEDLKLKRSESLMFVIRKWAEINNYEL